MNKFTLRQSLILLLTATIWGVAFVAQSVGMDYVEPFTFNGVRNLIGAVVLVPVILALDRQKDKKAAGEKKEDITKRRARPFKMRSRRRTSSYDIYAHGLLPGLRAKALRHSLRPEQKLRTINRKKGLSKELILGGVSCGIILFIASSLQQFGIGYTTVGKAGFITAMYIVLVPILGIFLNKKTGLRMWVAVAMAVVGLYLLCMTGDSFGINIGDVLLLLCAVAFSFHILVIDYFSSRVDGVKMSCIQFFTCGVISSVCMFIFETPQMSQILAACMPILYAGVMSCGVAYTLQIVGQRGMNPTVASLILSLESVISLLSGWLILNQRLSTRELIGCAIMFAAIILVQLPEKNKK